ncbi:hypothetical protein [Flavobacterium rhizosphaerae]|uniref:Uncharacterized protein n=1 Tax=Flavobacterium rhizosphaerae TaxID=3163298 RepID=A0ABW8YUM8_9FLAO
MKNFKLDNNVKTGSGFKVPDGYFESFTEKMMQQLPQKQTVVKPLYRRLPVWVRTAAIFILLVGIAFFIKNTKFQSAPNSQDIEDYLVYQTNFTSYDMMQHLNHKDIEELESSIAISDDAIENYLNENVYLSE